MAKQPEDKRTDLEKINRPLADPNDPRLVDPENIPPPDKAAQDAEKERRQAEAKKSLQDVEGGITTPSEEDVKVGVSHPSVINRPGTAADPNAPYAASAPRGQGPVTERTLAEQNAGRDASKTMKLPDDPDRDRALEHDPRNRVGETDQTQAQRDAQRDKNR